MIEYFNYNINYGIFCCIHFKTEKIFYYTKKRRILFKMVTIIGKKMIIGMHRSLLHPQKELRTSYADFTENTQQARPYRAHISFRKLL